MHTQYKIDILNIRVHLRSYTNRTSSTIVVSAIKSFSSNLLSYIFAFLLKVPFQA